MKRLIAKTYSVDDGNSGEQIWNIVAENLESYFDKFYREIQDVNSDDSLTDVSEKITDAFIHDHPELTRYAEDISGAFYDQVYNEMIERDYQMWYT